MTVGNRSRIVPVQGAQSATIMLYCRKASAIVSGDQPKGNPAGKW